MLKEFQREREHRDARQPEYDYPLKLLHALPEVIVPCVNILSRVFEVNGERDFFPKSVDFVPEITQNRPYCRDWLKLESS